MCGSGRRDRDSFHVKRELALPDVPRETTLRLQAYVALLLRWNQTINLISPYEEAAVWHRHILDSLVLQPLLPASFSHAIDIGSGGGLPGLVLAIATDRPFHLIEADRRKAAFLREAARETGAPVTIHNERVERVTIPPAPVITARAAAPLAKLLQWSEQLLSAGGVCIFPKGCRAEAELTAASGHWNMRSEQFRSPTNPRATILRISEIRCVSQHS